ncbi:hypothetical protein [Herbaspirillum frisingense]|uniref:hypothetical protein n=1 Tax=Herbaspirillum frisingense TaxID=92645 RepID=UPI001F332F74|nr:hypothetical protein [Herbaspirillum frisingense]UIN21228.1 hypothetical protein LAZ82_22705 [Herbaspirillum frisingense]
MRSEGERGINPASLPYAMLVLVMALLLSLFSWSARAQADPDLKALVDHLKFVIPDETALVDPHRFERFVAQYQKRASAAGLHDIDRQTAYVLVAVYTSGKGIEQREFKQLMAHPPTAPDEFSDAMIGLPQSVYDSGAPLWENDAYAKAR